MRRHAPSLIDFILTVPLASHDPYVPSRLIFSRPSSHAPSPRTIFARPGQHPREVRLPLRQEARRRHLRRGVVGHLAPRRPALQERQEAAAHHARARLERRQDAPAVRPHAPLQSEGGRRAVENMARLGAVATSGSSDYSRHTPRAPCRMPHVACGMSMSLVCHCLQAASPPASIGFVRILCMRVVSCMSGGNPSLLPIPRPQVHPSGSRLSA